IKHSVDRFVIVSIFIPKLRLILILNSFLGSSDSLVFSELFHSLAPRPLAARSYIRRRITIPLTLSNLKLLRRITRTENILHRNFTRRQVAIQNRVASNIGISQSTFSVKVL